MTKLSMVPHLACVAGAFLLWPTATTALSSSDGSLTLDAAPSRTRPGPFLRSSVFSQALSPESGFPEDAPSAGTALPERYFEGPSVSLVEEGVGAGMLPDVKEVRALKKAVAVLELNLFSATRMIQRLQTELTDPAKARERRMVLQKLRDRIQRSPEEIAQLTLVGQGAKDSVIGSGPEVEKEVSDLVTKAWDLRRQHDTLLDTQMPSA